MKKKLYDNYDYEEAYQKADSEPGRMGTGKVDERRKGGVSL